MQLRSQLGYSFSTTEGLFIGEYDLTLVVSELFLKSQKDPFLECFSVFLRQFIESYQCRALFVVLVLVRWKLCFT